MFKVNDEVKTVGTFYPVSGTLGTVVSIQPDQRGETTYQVHHSGYQRHVFYEDELVLIPARQDRLSRIKTATADVEAGSMSRDEFYFYVRGLLR